MGVPTHGEAGQVGCHFFVVIVAALGATTNGAEELPILERGVQFRTATGVMLGRLTDGAGRGVLHRCGRVLIKRRGAGLSMWLDLQPRQTRTRQAGTPDFDVGAPGC
jgi:hypothetical protein